MLWSEEQMLQIKILAGTSSDKSLPVYLKLRDQIASKKLHLIVINGFY